MKRISIKIAKAIKKAGYQFKPAPTSFYTNSNQTWWDMDDREIYSLPRVLDIWLWLWREKKIYIDINCIQCSEYSTDVSIWHEYGEYHYECKFTDPEEAIISAIDYLADNDLIK